MKKRGGESLTFPPQEVEKWRDKAKEVWDKEVKRWEDKDKPAKEILKEIERYLKEH